MYLNLLTYLLSSLYTLATTACIQLEPAGPQPAGPEAMPATAEVRAGRWVPR